MLSTRSLPLIHETFLSLYKMIFSERDIKKELDTIFIDQEVEIDSYLNFLIESGTNHRLTYLINWLTKEELDKLLYDIRYPILVFAKDNTKTAPSILYKERSKLKCKTILVSEIDQYELQYKPNWENHICGKEVNDFPGQAEKILVVTCFPNKSVFSEDRRFTFSTEQDKNTPISRFLRLLASERREIIYIYVYAIISGIISLSLPLGIQSLIGFISSGQISSSVMVLISFVVLGIILTGAMQIMQLTLVEHIQQRLFAKTAFEFAFRIPKIKIESVLKFYPPELMNRFFDIVTVQKGLAKVLIEFSAALLQIIFGLILLSLYHSSFIFFGIFLMTVLGFILRFTGPKGIKTSLHESKYKYQVANWLEEIARSLSTFKLAGYSNLPIEKTDYYVGNYLHYRKQHFKVLISQYLSFVTFKTLITGGLLILGCMLLIEKEINIGQFVASEIIIILIMTAVEKVIIQLDNVYDLLTSIEKIGTVTDLPIEVSKGIKIENYSDGSGLLIRTKNLKYKYPSEPDYILKGIDLHIQAGEKVCLAGYGGSGKTTLINIILGFLSSYEGALTFNNISMRDINKSSLINLIGDNVSQEDLFDGTILENITLGRANVKMESVLWAIEAVGLHDFISVQPSGIKTWLTGGKLGISETVARKIILARSIVTKPKLLILEDFLLGIEREQKNKLLQLLTGNKIDWTLILLSNDPAIMKVCDKTFILKEGKIVSSGSFDEIREDIYFKDLVTI